MKSRTCPTRGSKMKRNGKTKAGSQRWRCADCNASCTNGNDVSQRELNAFLRWLLSNESQSDMPGGGRTFRRHAMRFWGVWPMPEAVDEMHRVIHVDGIYLARGICILIACSAGYVLSWYLARGETTRARKALLAPIAPPGMVVSDGGSGFLKAVAEVWPATKVQRAPSMRSAR